MQSAQADDIVRRLAASLRAAELYSVTHPLVQRSVGGLAGSCATALESAPSVTVGFIGDEVVVDQIRLAKSSASLAGFVRGLRDREIDKITFARGITAEELRRFIEILAERGSAGSLAQRVTREMRHVTIGRIVVEDDEDQQVGIAAARQVYNTAVETAESLWNTAKAGEQPDPRSARTIIESLAKMISGDRTSLMALTALKKYDNYTFTHMVNVSALAMAQARALNIEGPLLREFGFAALMHDIGKVHTPLDILNKPDQLTREEFGIMQRHVIDGAHILRRTPEMPALAPIVAFEHHLKQDLSGYPENIGSRRLNLCTTIVSIADVFDALRSHRPYRKGLPTARVRAIMAEQANPAFHRALLKRFVNLVGLFPVGSLVRLRTEELAVVTAEHPVDPFRPQVRIVRDRDGAPVEEPLLINTWERQDREEHPRAVVEAVEPDTVDFDPLTFLEPERDDG
ncbi:MAG TPA: HD domain-containing phosphohydrolase [Vicinamibacterales bacterium]|jgi:putative nucleotidyltransferase with HDIG domain